MRVEYFKLESLLAIRNIFIGIQLHDTRYISITEECNVFKLVKSFNFSKLGLILWSIFHSLVTENPTR